MAMLRPPGKARKIAEHVMKGKGVKIPASDRTEKVKVNGPYLQH